MQFQTLLDPFKYALERQGTELQQEGQRINNAMGLLKVGKAQTELDAMQQDLAESKAGAASMGGIKPGGLEARGADGGAGAVAPLSSGALLKDARQFEAMANRVRGYNPGLSEKYLAKAESARKDAFGAQEKEFNRNDKFFDELGNAATQAAQSPEAMGQALALLSRKLPPGMDLDKVLYGDPKQGGLGLKQGPNGMPVWDRDTWKQIGQFSAAGKEQHRMDHDLKMESMRREEELRRVRTEERIAAHQTRLEAIARDRAVAENEGGKLQVGHRWVDAKDHSKGMEKIPLIGDMKPVNEAMKDLEKDPLWKNYDRYQQARGTSDMIEQKLARGEPITAADVQQLRTHYTNIKEDFRARAGGKWNEKEFDKLNGVFQEVEKWATSVGRGTPAAATSTARTVMAVINDEYSTRTKNLAIEELKMAKNVAKRNGNPENLRLKANIPYLVRTGQASIGLDDEGVKHIRIKTPEGEKVFPYPEGAY